VPSGWVFLWACSSDPGPTKTDSGTGAPTTDPTTADDSATADPTDPAAHTGSPAAHTGAESGAHTGSPSGLDGLVPGEWRPVSMTQNGYTTILPDDPATYLILDAGGGVGFGCDGAPFGTWTFDPAAPYPAVGLLQMDFGSPVTWYLLELDANALVFVEGGDQFDYARGACP
jgi:hypothetical protein